MEILTDMNVQTPVELYRCLSCQRISISRIGAVKFCPICWEIGKLKFHKSTIYWSFSDVLKNKNRMRIELAFAYLDTEQDKANRMIIRHLKKLDRECQDQLLSEYVRVHAHLTKIRTQLRMFYTELLRCVNLHISLKQIVIGNITGIWTNPFKMFEDKTINFTCSKTVEALQKASQHSSLWRMI